MKIKAAAFFFKKRDSGGRNNCALFLSAALGQEAFMYPKSLYFVWEEPLPHRNGLA